MRFFILNRKIFSVISLQILVSLLLALSSANALTLTKDTVYTSDLLGRTDSVSLVNPTNDSLNIDSLIWKTPAGKHVELAVGFNLPYSSRDKFESWNFDVRRIVSNSNKVLPLVELWVHLYGLKILPKGRIPVTGFVMANTFLPPVTKKSEMGSIADTLSTLLIFHTTSGADTLTIIGTVRQSTSGIASPVSRDPDAPPSPADPEKEKSHNAVGRILRRGHPINSNSEFEIHFRFPRGH